MKCINANFPSNRIIGLNVKKIRPVALGANKINFTTLNQNNNDPYQSYRRRILEPPNTFKFNRHQIPIRNYGMIIAR